MFYISSHGFGHATRALAVAKALAGRMPGLRLEPADTGTGVAQVDGLHVDEPGYGIISECVANDTALPYTSRGRFREYGVLVDAMPRMLRSGFIDHADLFAGRWTPHLEAVLAQGPPPERPAVNGAEVAAEEILTVVRRSF